MKTQLYFGLGNAKLSKTIANFALPAGHSCLFAKDCFSCSDENTGKITDGKDTKFRCFSATSEARATTVRVARWRNFRLMKQAKSVRKMAEIIDAAIPKPISHVRLHVSGDFYSLDYLKAWINVAVWNPDIIFYGYTKALPLWLKLRNQMPSNFRLVASWGGTHDHLIIPNKLPSAVVVFSEEQAARLGLPIDHDDSHAMLADHNFALLLHAPQPKGTPAAAAWNEIRKLIGGYKKGKARGKSPENKVKKELAIA